MIEHECGSVTAVEAIRFLPSRSPRPEVQRSPALPLMSVNDVIHQSWAFRRTNRRVGFCALMNLDDGLGEAPLTPARLFNYVVLVFIPVFLYGRFKSGAFNPLQ